MAKPLVSILIISYNQIDFIEEALCGAFEQDYDNLEVVVADDGSTDGTDKIIMKYAHRFPHRLVPLVGGPNLGITGNSNRGLRACKGKYICWQGGDDILMPNKVSSQVKWMESDERRSVCYHDVEVFYSSSLKRETHLFSKRLMMREGTSSTVVRHGTFMCACSVMFRQSSLPELFCNPLIKTASDWLLVIEVLEKNFGIIGYVRGVHARYRRHSGNVTQQKAYQLKEQLDTLNIVETKYPHLHSECRQRRAVLYFIESWKSLSKAKYDQAVLFLLKSFLVCRGIWIAPLTLLIQRVLGLRM